jgi:hypothetical protein
MALWEVLPGGRIKRFQNRQVRHHCRKRRRGRPAIGKGLCYRVNVARAQRHYLAAQLRQLSYDASSLDDFALVVPSSRLWW